MNIKQLAAAISLLTTAASAFAYEPEFAAPDVGFISARTRTDVTAEIMPTMHRQTEYVVPDAGFISSKTRAEVAVEIMRARADGTLIPNDAVPVKDDAAAPRRSVRRSRQDILQSSTVNGQRRLNGL
jgi:hypothetical protein